MHIDKFHYGKKTKENAAFGWHTGLYEYNVLPFGVMNGHSTSQQLMSVVPHELGDSSVANLVDTIIFSPTLEENTKHIQKVFDHSRQDLRLKLPKCKFIQNQVQLFRAYYKWRWYYG